jgi:hypothetical protein
MWKSSISFRVQSKFNKRPNKIAAEVTMKQCRRIMIEATRKTKLTGSRVGSSWKNEDIYIKYNNPIQ